jgi:hypothetical protein
MDSHKEELGRIAASLEKLVVAVEEHSEERSNDARLARMEVVLAIRAKITWIIVGIAASFLGSVGWYFLQQYLLKKPG